MYYPTIESLAVDPADGTMYAGTGAGVFKSSNGGGFWSAAGTSLAGHILALMVDPAQNGTVYVGTDNGVFKSVNGGAFWAAISAGLPDSISIHSLAIDPSDTQTLYAGGTYGVYKSTDGGNSWTATNSRALVHQVTALAVDPVTRTVYAGTWNALYETTDGGSSWKLVNIPVARSSRITAIAVNGTTLCAVTDSGAVYKGTTTMQ